MRTPKLVPPCRATLRAVSLLTVVGLMGACADGPSSPMDPVTPDAARNPTAQLTVTYPQSGATLSGPQTFQASVNWSPITSYDVYWQDGAGGAQTKMATDPTGTFKQATVDVGSWVSGTHTLIFTAKSHTKTLDTKSVTVTVNGTTPPPPTPVSGNPLAGASFWVDPNSKAANQIKLWSAYPDSVAQMHKIADHSQADWFGGWNTDIQSAVDARTTTIVGAGGLPVFVAYNIPNRDCGGYSAGGAQTADAYATWIRAFAAGLKNRQAVVVLEPDGTASTTCLSSSELQARFQMLTDAVQVLKGANAIVYLDAGNSNWIAASDMANRLQQAGIAYADGFSLNVSNFETTADNTAYGTTISGLVGGKHFIIDTSRNGLGPTANHAWCNPPGRGLGSFATTSTGNALVDAYLWVKRPGESDGTCNGGPAAGAWWADYALGLAQNMPALLAAQ